MEKELNRYLFGTEFVIQKIEDEESKTIIYLESNQKECNCTKCGVASSSFVCYYNRRIQDTPIHNKTVWLNVRVKKMICYNPLCEQKIFSEVLPFAKVSQVKTDALLNLILGVSIYMSNTSASLILGFLGVEVSADTIKNIYDKIEIKDNPDIEEIGVDDVAKRKGQTYATAIYDLKTHELVALLDGRTKETLKEWLIKHTKVRKIARDRASGYAAAISEVLPKCIQVADRFHLLDNLLVYLKDIFYKAMPEKIFIKDGKILEKTPRFVIAEQEEINQLEYDNSVPVDEKGNEIHFDNQSHEYDDEQYAIQHQKRLEKQEKIHQIQEKYKQGKKHNYEKIALEYEISIPTARKYVRMAKEEVEKIDKRKVYKKRKTKFDDYLNIIYKMLRDGKEHDTILAYIVGLGYHDDYRALSNCICFIARNNFPHLNIKKQLYYEYKIPKDVEVIKKSELLKYILTIKEKTKRDKRIEKNIGNIKEKYKIVGEVEEIFKEFHKIIMGDDPREVNRFVKEYENTIIKSFCKGIKKDITAIKNAISYEISSGFVEGNNNKFKLIKRIVYGKMNLVNLFFKCWVAFKATKKDFDLFSLI